MRGLATIWIWSSPGRQLESESYGLQPCVIEDSASSPFDINLRTVASEASQKHDQRSLVVGVQLWEELQTRNGPLCRSARRPALPLVLRGEARRIEELLETGDRSVVQ